MNCELRSALVAVQNYLLFERLILGSGRSEIWFKCYESENTKFYLHWQDVWTFGL